MGQKVNAHGFRVGVIKEDVYKRQILIQWIAENSPLSFFCGRLE